MRTRTPSSLRTATIGFIFITVLLDMVAIGIMAPVLPKLIISFEHGDIARAASVAGVIGLVWAGMQFVFSPVVGALSDRYGRRPIILLSNFGLGLDYLIMALAPSLPWLFVGRMLSGVAGASFSTAAAYIADVTPPEKRAGQMGLLGAAFGIGFVLGPAMGGMLGELDLRLPFWVAAGLSLANAAYGYFVLPESLPIQHRATLKWEIVSPLHALKLLGSHPRLTGLAAAAFLGFLGHESLHATFVLYTDYRYGWGASQVGLALALVGVGSGIVAGLLVRPAVARFGEHPVLVAGLIFGVVGFTAYAFAPTGALFLASTPLMALWALAAPAAQSSMTRQVGPSEQGRLQGALSSLRGMAGLVGPLLFTQTFVVGISGGHRTPGAPYLVVAGLLIFAIVAVTGPLRLGRRSPSSVFSALEKS
jgi:MFS transporter, DHA1 family, tetracycline resistance protein